MLNAGRKARFPRPAVKHDDVVAHVDQVAHHMAPNETGPTNHQNSHRMLVFEVMEQIFSEMRWAPLRAPSNSRSSGRILFNMGRRFCLYRNPSWSGLSDALPSFCEVSHAN